MLHLFEFFNKLTLKVNIFILKLLLFVAIKSDGVIEFIHLLL